WATLTQAAFSYLGVEIVCVTAGEAQNPRRNVPKAIRRVIYVSRSTRLSGTLILTCQQASISSHRCMLNDICC
ncbi:MAG: hypothetical protein EOO65_03750, partial [Methanosarcinales archaeon]